MSSAGKSIRHFAGNPGQSGILQVVKTALMSYLSILILAGVSMDIRDEIEKGIELQGESRKAAANFLQIELDTSLTFVEAALSAGDNAEKRSRDRANARKGYDTIMRFSRKYAVPPDAAPDFDERLRHLKSALQLLGETGL
ncbi:MAG TPA: hypothetical protein VFU86_21895 [Terriglobales bacterium]|nr:hypothetical protein [Terriglobales bacterium]